MVVHFFFFFFLLQSGSLLGLPIAPPPRLLIRPSLFQSRATRKKPCHLCTPAPPTPARPYEQRAVAVFMVCDLCATRFCRIRPAVNGPGGSVFLGADESRRNGERRAGRARLFVDEQATLPPCDDC